MDLTSVDLSTMPDDELAHLQRDVSAEQRQRAALSSIPLQIADLATQYRAGGGNTDDLLDALEPSPTTDQEV